MSQTNAPKQPITLDRTAAETIAACLHSQFKQKANHHRLLLIAQRQAAPAQ